MKLIHKNEARISEVILRAKIRFAVFRRPIAGQILKTMIRGEVRANVGRANRTYS